AELQRAVVAARAPLRPDGMGPQRHSAAEDGEAPAVLRRGPVEAPLVTLTFDDGPHPFTTPRILAALRRESVPATFFMIGAEVERHPELAREVLANGHALGNHTWHHLYMDHLDA